MPCEHTVETIEVMTMTKIKTYSELKRIRTFEERYEYLRIGGTIGVSTFGSDRHLNQLLYKSRRWRCARDLVIIRDLGCDLGIEDYEIFDVVYVHHMNPITIEDIANDVDELYDPEFLICTSFSTHNAIHFGDASLLPPLPIERKRGDTTPW